MLLVGILETSRLGGFDPLDSAGVAVPLVVGLCLALATHTSELNVHALTGCFIFPEVFVSLCTFGQSSHWQKKKKTTKQQKKRLGKRKKVAVPSHSTLQ